MIVKEPGKIYTLQTAQDYDVIDIVFCGKDADGTFVDGITNEELVNILEHRLSYLVTIKPTTENMNALTHIRQTKNWLHTRNYQKIQRQRENGKQHAGPRNGVHVQTQGR